MSGKYEALSVNIQRIVDTAAVQADKVLEHNGFGPSEGEDFARVREAIAQAVVNFRVAQESKKS